MMNLNVYLQNIRNHLILTHSNVLQWFFEKEELKNFRPENGGWTILEILEHIALTSHFLLILIHKGADKALRNIHHLSLSHELENFHFDLSKFQEIGIHKAFVWVRPEHMEPQGNKSEVEIQDELSNQLRICLNHLESLKNGEGLLYQTTMTVQDMGKINVYEYIYFLGKHAERHLQQMQLNKTAYLREK